MLILYTNHYSVLEGDGPGCWRLKARLESSDDWRAVCVITEAEVLKGRLAQIQRTKQPDRGIEAYSFLQDSVTHLNSWLILPWTEQAADIYDSLKHLRSKVGAMDLRIAAIALSINATVLTRNLVDFTKVPGLRVENWLD
ncbi:MAG: type II toxin-antitoxin system VapC family toxin [Prosthecobacter sp.]|jgi:tRNA(fMet)-specific endonuclease VapC|uniref:type II toxin-antitoxin system VapC family toxin n=1 Tax=Prosthecobacter sp. TaxID=1965333 RepID=UPI0019E594A4|nr:type II toxin-antitoxin system VapC family toxin [Prosthecobacter sp.]MBE2282829.1 type II toxin-antitoxin system VapC family toxin [Prosthecobacter sp.]